MNSINTNVGAMLALQNLNAINRDLLTTQNRISTGLKIAGPKDNPAIWAIAQRQRSESKAMEAVKASLQRGQSVVDVAMSAGESISDLLGQMKETMLAASDPSNNADSKAAYNEQYKALRRQIDLMAKSATFNGINLISAGGTGQIKALANTKGDDTIDIAHVDLSTTGAALSGLPADLTGTIGTTQLDAMSDSIKTVNLAIGRLGTGAKQLDNHLDFVGKLQDTIDAGVGRLVDADLAKESAKLQALQVKQQLAIQVLGIMNRAPSILLQLFQGR